MDVIACFMFAYSKSKKSSGAVDKMVKREARLKSELKPCIRMQTQGQQFSVRAWEMLFHSNVSRITLSVVHERCTAKALKK